MKHLFVHSYNGGKLVLGLGECNDRINFSIDDVDEMPYTHPHTLELRSRELFGLLLKSFNILGLE